MWSGMATPLGNYKEKLTVESLCEATYGPVLASSLRENPPCRFNENKNFSDCICPDVYPDIVLIYIFGDTRISSLPNIHLGNRSLPLKMWARPHFSALFHFRGAGCSVYTLKSSGRVCPKAFSILETSVHFPCQRGEYLSWIFLKLSHSLRKLPKVFGFRVLLWWMQSDLSGRHRCILQKEDSLRRPLQCPESWYPIPKTSPSPPMAMADASPIILPLHFRETYT